MEPNLAMRNLFKYLAFVGVSLASLYTLSTSSIYTNRRQEEAIPPDEIFIGKARSKIAVVTRVHGSFATNMPDKEKIKSFVKAARVYSSKIIICVRILISNNCLVVILCKCTDCICVSTTYHAFPCIFLTEMFLYVE